MSKLQSNMDRETLQPVYFCNVFPFLNYIKGGIFIYIDIIDKVKWQAGQGGTHLAILHKIPSRDPFPSLPPQYALTKTIQEFETARLHFAPE